MVFKQKGCKSPLMYIHHSPGLLRIKTMRDKKGKKKAGGRVVAKLATLKK